ncbi:MazG-like family protein [Actinoplanes sp. CA-252034]|uniref:MazG-like family protein n=1 Tax=Actinoplanes sp. CA-252034 TaxID=3239906 RepID=UPI003D97C4BC
MTTPTITDAARRISAQLAARSNPELAGLPQTLCQALKVQEEAGEMAQAVIGVLGQNPRKGVTHTWCDVVNEAIDVAMSALVLAETIQPGQLDATLADRLDYLRRRAAGSGAPDSDHTPASTPDTSGQAIHADLRPLADFLAANPDVRGDISHCVFADGDQAGIAEITRLAAALDVAVTDHRGKPPTGDSTHFYAQRTFGRVSFQASYITDACMADHAARTSYISNVHVDKTAVAA